LSKKTESFLQRTAGIAPSLGRTGSLDLTRSNTGALLPRSSEDGAIGRLRRLSFVHDSRSPLTTPLQKEINATADAPFGSILQRLEQSKDILSSSPDISLAPPSLIVTLAAKEAKDPSRCLLADEQAGLKSILGWEGKEVQGTGMTGTVGFVRQQEFSVLHSRHVPSTQPLPLALDPSLISSLDSYSPPNYQPPIFTSCEKARWITYTYYSRDSRSDKPLGDAIVDLCSAADKPCDKLGCLFKRGEHELRFIHGGLQIVVKVEPRDITDATSQSDIIEMWETCRICAARSRLNHMNDGT
jgi:1-phosphatidylinositol-3-phosphate 5-kinase